MTMVGRRDLTPLMRGAVAARRPASSDFDLVPGRPEDGVATRQAAVLVGIVDRPIPTILLTRRSQRLSHHPGQIAFPGGKIDPDDAGPEACALREAGEEVGLAPGSVRVVGRLSPHQTVTGFSIVPVLAHVRPPPAWRPGDGEVAEVFEVPLEHLLAMAHYRIESRAWRGTDRRYFAVPWGPYYIWGATARILRGLAECWQADP